MKIIGRIAIILVAALLVVGATVALSSAGALNGLLNTGRFERGFDRPASSAPGELAARPGERRQFERQSDRGRAGQSFDLDGGFERGRFRESGFNLFGASEILRNLMTVTIIVAAIVALTLAWQWLGRARQRRKAA